MTALLVFAIYSYTYSHQGHDGIVHFSEDRARIKSFKGPRVISWLSVFLFAYIGQHGSFEVYRSLKRPSYSQWRIVANCAVFLSWMTSVLFSVPCFLNLGDAIESNLLTTFKTDNTLFIICKGILGIVMLLTYPLDCFVFRQNVNQAIFVHWLGRAEYMTFWSHFFTTVFAWASTSSFGKSTAVHYIPIVTALLISVFLLFFFQQY